MASIPTPRSRQQILSDMLDSLSLATGISRFKVGGPLLSILEAASSSDARNTQDIFQLLASIGLDTAEGLALDNIGANEGVSRLLQARSTGTVTITDTSFTKQVSKLSQAYPAPIVGSTTIYVEDASTWDAAGQVYIGRGTANVEGPLNYTRVGNVLTITATTVFHNRGETVTVAQGGNRIVSAGTVVSTAQGSIVGTIEFATSFTTVLLDGETTLENVQVVAKVGGLTGNVPAFSVNEFSGASPFTGASVSNPLPYVNGRDVETDNDYRERIRSARNNKQRGTQNAIENAVVGISSTVENKTVASASLVRQKGQIATLYLDDGTGYEEQSDGVGLEVVVDSAIGGEQDFQTIYKPVAKAYVESVNSAPFVMTDGSKLNVLVGDTVYSHSFSSSDFNSILAASAYEVVASINGNNSLGFSARVTGSGLKVALQAKSEANDEIQLQAVGTGDIDANEALLFPVTKARTAMLYKNDRLLSKDGLKAVYKSQPFADWSNFSGSQTLYLQVDQTPASIYVFAAQDFIDAGTGYGAVGKNSLEAWVAVINAAVAGVTATVELDRLVLTSNAGEVNGAAVVISGGTLVANNMFAAGGDYGAAKDYELERSTGQVYLNEQLTASDRLTFGSLYTRAFLESLDVASVDVLQDKSMWWAVDGQTTIPTDGITSTSPLTASIAKVTDSGMHVTVACSDPAPVFDNIAEGDWAVFHDAGLLGRTVQNAWRVLDPQDSVISFEKRGMNVPRGGFQLVAISSTKAMAIGGFTALHPKKVANDGTAYIPEVKNGNIYGRCHTDTCEIFDKSAGTWTYCSNMGYTRVKHTAVKYTVGGLDKVLVVGGLDSSYTTLATAQIYDVLTDTWGANIDISGIWANGVAGHTATVYSAGSKILIAGGFRQSGTDGVVTALTTTAIFDVATQTFAATGNLGTARYNHAAVLDPTNAAQVFVAGGMTTGTTDTATAELFSGAAWAALANSMLNARSSFALVNPSGSNYIVAIGDRLGETPAAAISEEYNAGAPGAWAATTGIVANLYGFSPVAITDPSAVANKCYVYGQLDYAGLDMKHYNYVRGTGWTDITGVNKYAKVALGKALAGICALGTDVLVAGGINYRSMANTQSNYWSEKMPWGRVTSNFEILASATDTWDYTSQYSEMLDAASGLSATTLPSAGLTFARTAGILQETTITTANDYTADTFVNEINAELRGATAEVYRTNKVRVRTNSFAETVGDIALVGSNCSELSIDDNQVQTNEVGHLASIDSGNPGVGTPEDFRVYSLAYSQPSSRLMNFADAVTYPFATLPSLTPIVAGLKRPPGGKNPNNGGVDNGNEILEYGNSKNYFGELAGYTIDSASQSQWSFCNNIQAEISTITAYQQEHLPHEPYIFAHPYSFGLGDELDVVIDGDTETKNYNVPMSYKLTVADNNYDQNVNFSGLKDLFGTDYDFSGFELHMPARKITLDTASNAELFWRYKKPGKEGERCCMRFVYPDGPDADVAATVVYDQTTPVTTNTSITAKTTLPLMTNVNVNLNSGSALEGSVLRDSSKLALVSMKSATIAGAPIVGVICGYKVDSFYRPDIINVADQYVVVSLPVINGTQLTASGIKVNDILWLEVASPSSTTLYSGSFTVTAVDDNGAFANKAKISFSQNSLNDHTVAVPAGAAITATVSFDSQGELSLDGVAGDYFRLSNIGANVTNLVEDGLVGNAVSYSEVDDVTAKINAVSGEAKKQWISGQMPCGMYFTTDTVYPQGPAPTKVATDYQKPAPVSLLTTDNISIFTGSTCTAASIETAILNISDCPIWAQVKTGGAFNRATFEDSTYVWAYNRLVDGWNIVKSVSSYPSNPNYYYELELGVSITSDVNYDWQNEDVYLVPTTPRAVAKWMNTPCISGLFSSAEVATSKAGKYLQISSLTPGSAGAVQVSGGTANLATAAVHNSAELIEGAFYDGMLVSVPSTETSGFHGGKWVRIDNTYQDIKKNTWGVDLTSITAAGVWTFSGAIFTILDEETTFPVRVMVEKVNNLVALHFPRSVNTTVPQIYDEAHTSDLTEGDYIYLYDGGVASSYTGTTVGGINLNNQGTFKVIRAEENCDTVTVWIENPNAVEELSECQYKCIGAGAPVPGDYLVLNSSTPGSDNVGAWTIESVGLAGGVQFSSTAVLAVSTAEGAPAAWSGTFTPGAGDLKIKAAAPARVYKKIITVIADASNTDYSHMFLERGEQVSLVREDLGSVITALDKLAFSTSKVVGVDGYRHNTGLIEEANKVVYGDPKDQATYPGYAAAGATINIAGPFIKRVQLSLSLRINSAFASADLADRVKSAVATVINAAGIGDSVSISDVVSAASQVPGVIAVAVLKPTYTSANDLLPVNANEKLMVLDINNDILVSFVGI